MENYNLSRLNLLVIDDNANMRRVVRNVLNTFGITHIAEAKDGSSALEALKVFKADIAICDWIMEPMDGVKFVRTVRTAPDSPNPFLPVIMLTAHSDAFRVIHARDSGIHEYLTKPVSAKLLYLRITSIIEKQRMFVKTGKFFGPDRRRRKIDADGAERRTHANQSKVERRVQNLPFAGAEKRHGWPGYIAKDTRGGGR